MIVRESLVLERLVVTWLSVQAKDLDGLDKRLSLLDLGLSYSLLSCLLVLKTMVKYPSLAYLRRQLRMTQRPCNGSTSGRQVIQFTIQSTVNTVLYVAYFIYVGTTLHRYYII